MGVFDDTGAALDVSVFEAVLTGDVLEVFAGDAALDMELLDDTAVAEILGGLLAWVLDASVAVPGFPAPIDAFDSVGLALSLTSAFGSVDSGSLLGDRLKNGNLELLIGSDVAGG